MDTTQDAMGDRILGYVEVCIVCVFLYDLPMIKQGNRVM